MKKPLVTVLFSSLLGACSSAAGPAPVTVVEPATGASTATADAAASATIREGTIRLHRSACFGRCPQYQVTIGPDGAVLFEGERFVAALGPHSGRADEAKLKSLRDLLRQPESRQLKDIYRPGLPGCSRWATDMPSVEIDWALDGERHHLNHYQGCQNPVPQIGTIATAIDEVAESQQWIKSGTLQ